MQIRATMSHHINFQKAWLGLIPLLEGPNGDLLLEQGSRPCRCDAMGTSSSCLTQQAVGGGHTHTEQVFAALLAQV